MFCNQTSGGDTTISRTGNTLDPDLGSSVTIVFKLAKQFTFLELKKGFQYMTNCTEVM